MQTHITTGRGELRRPATALERLCCAMDSTLRTLAAREPAARPIPGPAAAEVVLSRGEARRVGELLRVDHVGEVCAQALYEGQALTCRTESVRQHLRAAAREEADHLAWTRERLEELGDRTSLLNPLWYAGAFALGAVAGRISDAVSLGFVDETERQVEAHLAGHLDALPTADTRSRAIILQMKRDEMAHAAAARERGAVRLAPPVPGLMRACAKVMTSVARYI